MTMPFEHDALVVLIRTVKPRKITHDDDEQLALDVGLWCGPGESGAQWDAALRSLIDGSPDDPTDWLMDMGATLRSVPFAADYVGYIATFWRGSTRVAKLDNARLDRFSFEFSNDRHDDRLTFRLRCDAVHADAVGALSQEIGHFLRLETVLKQGALDLED